MIKSVIDMGSNSVRLMVARCSDHAILESEKHMEMTRLALDLEESGLLQPGPMEETLKAVARFREMSEAAGAGVPTAYATSAVRDADNGAWFAAEVQKVTGVPVHILPGPLEAELGFMGVIATMDDPYLPILVVDIGGGSTEFIVGSGKDVAFAESYNVGAVRMTGRFVTTDPVDSTERQALLSGIEGVLAPVLGRLSDMRFQRVYGIGGTLTTAAAMAMEMRVYDPQRIQNAYIARDTLAHLTDNVFAMDTESRRKLPGLQPKRADVIPAGLLIMKCILDRLNIDGFYASDADNLEGVLYKYHMVEAPNAGRAD